MLFAEGSEVAASASVVACLLAAITGLFSWLGQRDKLRYDARLREQDFEIAALKQQHHECEENHAELKVEHAEMRAEIAQLRRRIDELTGIHRPLP